MLGLACWAAAAKIIDDGHAEFRILDSRNSRVSALSFCWPSRICSRLPWDASAPYLTVSTSAAVQLFELQHRELWPCTILHVLLSKNVPGSGPPAIFGELRTAAPVPCLCLEEFSSGRMMLTNIPAQRAHPATVHPTRNKAERVLKLSA